MMSDLKGLLINKEKLLKIQRSITGISGIPVFIIDINGDFVTEPTHIFEPCQRILGPEARKKRCQEEFLKVLENLRQSKTPVLSLCDTGCTKFAIPIIVQDELLGALIGCQMKPSEISQEAKDNSHLQEIVNSLTEIINIFIHDELELINLTREIVRNCREIALLYEISDIFGIMFDVEKASQIILERLLDVVEAERISLMLIDPQTKELKIVFAKGLPEEVVKNTKVKIGEGIAGFVVKEGKPLLVEDIEDNPQIKDLVIKEGGFKSSSFLSLPLICAPLKIEDRVMGVINLTDKKFGKKFTLDDLNLLSAISTQIAAVIENKRLFNDIRELFINTVRTLTSVLEAKDHYTYGHSQRVSKYALAVAQELNLSQDEKTNLELAALLHDIGKIGVPEHILLKPDRLTAEEFEEIKKHSLNSVQILGHIKQIVAILPAILHHHERFNGGGYPDGLRGDEIPLFSKILAVVDAFDAMLSQRPYRPALSQEVAVEEIKKNIGTQFDPVAAEAFLKALAKGMI